jgi:hypothetical protein
LTRRAAPFAAALAAAAAIRLWVAATQTYAVFLDETFQYLEQAHRIVFGYAILPWEYLEGLRSWLLPAALALPMAAAAAVVDSPGFYIPATRAACALLSLTVVWCAWRWGGRAGGPVAGALAAAFPPCGSTRSGSPPPR